MRSGQKGSVLFVSLDSRVGSFGLPSSDSQFLISDVATGIPTDSAKNTAGLEESGFGI